MSDRYRLLVIVLIALLFVTGGAAAHPLNAALGAGFTYQGKLTDGGAPANGLYDFRFSLFDDLNAGNQVGGALTRDDVTVADGLFTVLLDFGAVFDGTALFLDIGVRPGASSGAYTPLIPRQELTGAPYALYAAQSPWSGLTGVPAGFADGTDDGAAYTAGSGLALTGSQFSVTGAPWSGLTGVPAGFADGTDDGSAYTAGSGLALTGSAFSVTGAPWSGLTGMPAGFADGVDDDTTYTAGSGLALTGSQFSVTGAPWSGLTGMPAGFADGVDDNTTYTAGDGLELAGAQFKGKGAPYQNIVIVAKSGGDFTTIQAALNSIVDASASNRYLVYVAPGVYTEIVAMKPFVDLEGAGELNTRITHAGFSSNTYGTVMGADDAELRFLTVENTGGDWYAIAIYNNNDSLCMTHITAIATSGTYTYGVMNNGDKTIMTNVTVSASGGSYHYAIANIYSPSVLTNVTATATGGLTTYGLFNQHAAPVINSSSIQATGSSGSNIGIYNTASAGAFLVLVNHSQITGASYTIGTDAEFTVRVGASQLSGGALYLNGGTVACVGVYDEIYTSPGYTTCP